MATTKKKSTVTKASKTPKETSAITRKKRSPGKASAKLPASFTLEPKVPAAEPVIPHEEISLRAYFIAERRQQMGWPGDSATDWTDAQSQLKAEALEKTLPKR